MDELELHLLYMHKFVLVVGEDVAVVGLVVLLVAVEYVMQKGAGGPCSARRCSTRLELDYLRTNAQFVQIVRPALHHFPPCR